MTNDLVNVLRNQGRFQLDVSLHTSSMTSNPADGKLVSRSVLTEWLKERRRQTEENLTLLCPHVTWEVDNSGTVQVRSTYVSPSGTMAWQCQLCGSITNDTGHPSRVAQYWANNPKALIKRHKKMSRLARKLGRG